MFFRPFLTHISGRDLICYVDTDVRNMWPDLSEESAKKMISEFADGWRFHVQAGDQDFVPDDTDYMIGFLWTDNTEVFVDLLLQRQFDTYGECGPMTTLQTFRSNGEMVDPWEKGNACAWTRIVSGREAEHFLQIVRVHEGSIPDYLNGPRPDMPDGFIAPWP